MYQRFRQRGYSHHSLKKAKNKAMMSKCEELLTSKTLQLKNTEQNFPRIITRFGSQWTMVQEILERHWHILKSAPLIIGEPKTPVNGQKSS